MTKNSTKAWLVLSDGTVFEGQGFGAFNETIGEVVFTTGMTGYLEAMTGSDYYGQILIQTFPMLGNYGVNLEDMESDRAWVKGYIVREYSEIPSNFRSQLSIDKFMKEQNVFGLAGVDTRQLTRILRRKGILNGLLTCEDPHNRLASILKQLKSYCIDDGPEKVSCQEIQYFQPSNDDYSYRVVAYDFGIKRSQIKSLLRRGCHLTLVPYNTPASEVIAMQPDGIFLSDGPGDPGANQDLLDNIELLCQSGIPLLGIGMGHQLMAKANGAQTWKLKHGHRGVNQPVHDYKRQRIYITNQNHGYAVINESLDIEIGRISHINVNDKTCEGIKYLAFPGISTQFQPEPSATTEDTSYVYDDFISMIRRGI